MNEMVIATEQVAIITHKTSELSNENKSSIEKLIKEVENFKLD